jgi:hypothetical protein
MHDEPLSPSVVRGYRALLRRPSRCSHNDATPVHCPKCRSPMTVRLGANGPYFHCLCTRQ